MKGKGLGQIDLGVVPRRRQLLVAGGGIGSKPSPRGRGQLEGGRRHNDQVGGQGEIVEKGEIGMMALAADGGEGGRLIQAQTGAE